MSGAIYTAAEKDAALAKKAAADKAEQDYLEGLRRNESLPVGVVWRAWSSIVGIGPRFAANARHLCIAPMQQHPVCTASHTHATHHSAGVPPVGVETTQLQRFAVTQALRMLRCPSSCAPPPPGQAAGVPRCGDQAAQGGSHRDGAVPRRLAAGSRELQASAGLGWAGEVQAAGDFRQVAALGWRGSGRRAMMLGASSCAQ